MHANPFPLTGHKSSKLLELVHMDLKGPTSVQSMSGYKYWIVFIDDYSKFKVAIPLKKKSDAFTAFKTYKAYAENTLDVTIKSIQDDKGGEFMSKEFDKFCEDHGIARRHSVRNRPQQNGTAEQANRVGGERITSLLAEANLPMKFWAEALAALIHIWNRCPTAALKGCTPSRYGVALHMCTFRRISESHSVHTWRRVYSLSILMATKVGGFIYLPERR